MQLRSYQFRREREEAWRELESLVSRGEKKGLASLSPEELFRLPVLYRGTLSALSVARSISLDANVLRYLEALSARAYFLLYGVRGSSAHTIRDFLLRKFPAQVRASVLPIFLAALLMALGVFAGYALTASNPDWFYTFVSADMASGRTPTATTETLRETIFQEDKEGANALAVFSAFLFTHNSRVGMLAFALGFAFGLPTLFLMFYNGTVLGAFMALFASRGLGLDFLGWVLVHGTTELLAVILCGGAGLVLARSMILPGARSRLSSLAESGRRAAVIVLGSVMLLFVAGLLEGFARQLIQTTGERLTIAILMTILWATYLGFAGRWREETAGD